MEVVISTSKTNLIRSTMPELMALKLLALARRVLQTSPNTKHIDRKYRYIDRHNKNEGWTNSGAKAAGFYSKHVLWNKPT